MRSRAKAREDSRIPERNAFYGVRQSSAALGVRSEHGIALVITLLMLSVITFLAVAFLAMSRRDRAQVTATLDSDSSRNMSDTAFNRAQAEIIAQMLAHGDALSYDYMASHNYISPYGFNKNSRDTTNVNYDIYTSSGVINPEINMSKDPAHWAQNIADLFYDPRPPVFVVTNPAYPNNSDFRFWVDINRNGRFETNGYLPYMAEDGLQAPANFSFPAGFSQANYMNGEPEWIGVLRDPLNRHSATNQFIGRYAYMVLPIGKTLDFNYIHNWAKGNYSNSGSLTNDAGNGNVENDGFARDQGIASYELNLAALLDIVSPDAYEYGFPNYAFYDVKTPQQYQYFPPYHGNAYSANKGFAFDDAEAFVHYRYWRWPTLGGSQYLGFAPMRTLFPTLFPPGNTNFNTFGIDAYCVTAQTEPPFDPTNTVNIDYVRTTTLPWPGSYSSNMFYDPQDLFDPNRTSVAFTNRLLLAGSRTNSEDRYTFQRLLANIGTGSQPEYGVWVYNDSNQLTLRTKVNINFDNTAQIQNGPYSPMPTNLVNWTPLGFFTNAAELLLRSQTFTFTNYQVYNGRWVTNGTYSLANFGVTNIPIFRFYNPGVQYNEAIHRMLQLAANIYSTTVSSNYTPFKTGLPPQNVEPPQVRYPFVFRPLVRRVNIGTPNDGIDIVGFTNDVSDAYIAHQQMQWPFLDLNSNNVVLGYINDFAKRGSDFNISGIPWVVSAEQGLPQFYQYSYDNRILLTRKVLFSRYNKGGEPDTNRPPQYTNQFYVMSISNSFGIGAWNPYTTPFGGSLHNRIGGTAYFIGGTAYYLSNYVTIELTNNYHFGYLTSYSYVQNNPNTVFDWKAWNGVPNASSSNGFVTLFTTNFASVPPCYFSESQQRLVFFTNSIITSNSVLPQDTNQTGWPVHRWTLNVTNHVVYALFDGTASTGNALLDFVNLGPFGSSIDITNEILAPNGIPDMLASGPWSIGRATDLPSSPQSYGLAYQVDFDIPTDAIYANSLSGVRQGQQCIGGWVFAPGYNPSNVLVQTERWVANDPMVHYTAGDLRWPPGGDLVQSPNVGGIYLLTPVTNSVGGISDRYDPWDRPGSSDPVDMLIKDPLITSASAWGFPTNKYPSVGWLGRVHRGTPWQTVYFKSDNPANDNALSKWLSWTSSPWNTLTEPDTYPTNDWVLPDLFTAAMNDNSARGLLSVNQTNDAAWAAVLAGVIALTNVNGGVAIFPTNVYQFVDATNGINAVRSTNLNGLFHKVGEILAAPALTVQSPFLANTSLASGEVSDDVVERIPQQIMGLLKVGEPQFVIYSWGESLRPKSLYLSSPNNNLCTNYEITGEFLSRAVCHVVHTNGTPKMVIDSYNIEPAD
jgi:hypothetical protein